MKSESEFQKILKDKLSKGQELAADPKSSTPLSSSSSPPPPFSPFPASPTSSFSSTPKGFFEFDINHEGWKIRPVTQNFKAYQDTVKNEKPVSETPKVHIPIKETPRSKVAAPTKAKDAPVKVRVKRKLTYDQLKAVEVFHRFGEKAIGNDSTQEEIKSAYRRLAKTFHPDVGADSDEIFKLISFSYKKLIVA